MQLVDVAIIGGGLVGSVFARAIHRLGYKIALIDRAPEASLYASNLDNRGIALSLSTIQNLQTLHLWEQLAPLCHAIETVHVSEQGAFGFTKLMAKQYNLPALGCVISASQLGRTICAGTAQIPNLQILRPQEIKAATYISADKLWELTLNDQTVRAKMLVASDGTNSIIRKIAGVGINSIAFAQTAIVTNIHLDKPHTAIAFERFTNQGVLALLPFGHKLLKCVWTVDNNNLKELLNLTDVEFLNRLQAMMGFRAGKFNAIDTRLTFPIAFANIDKLYSNHIFFMGNAANTLHPVAAQGFNLGIRDAMTLWRLMRQMPHLEDIAQLGNLYTSERQIDQQQTSTLSCNLVHMFATSNMAVKIARRMGLFASEFCPPIKNRIIAQGLGLWM